MEETTIARKRAALREASALNLVEENTKLVHLIPRTDAISVCFNPGDRSRTVRTENSAGANAHIRKGSGRILEYNDLRAPKHIAD